MHKSKSMNESALIERVISAFELAKGQHLGLSDTATLPMLAAGHSRVTSADNFIEGLHFELGPYESFGHRALARNLSDLAAAGATPVGFMWCITLAAKDLEDPARLDGFLEGAANTAMNFQCPLLGGDITLGDKLSCAITIFGDTASDPLSRMGARVGDGIFLTDKVGASMSGLRLLNDHRDEIERKPFVDVYEKLSEQERAHIDAHLWPDPAIWEGEALLTHASACMDISDGLGLDLTRLCKASKVGAHVDEGKAYAEGTSVSGDDYVLVYTASEAMSRNCTQIGVIESTLGVRGLPEIGHDPFAKR